MKIYQPQKGTGSMAPIQNIFHPWAAVYIFVDCQLLLFTCKYFTSRTKLTRSRYTQQFILLHLSSYSIKWNMNHSTICVVLFWKLATQARIGQRIFFCLCFGSISRLANSIYHNHFLSQTHFTVSFYIISMNASFREQLGENNSR